MRSLLSAIGGFTTILDLLGASLVVAGTAMVYVPAAYVVAGSALLAISYRATGSGAPREDDDG